MTAPDAALARVEPGHLDVWSTDGPQCAQNHDGYACTVPHGHPGTRHLHGAGRWVVEVWDEVEG